MNRQENGLIKVLLKIAGSLKFRLCSLKDFDIFIKQSNFSICFESYNLSKKKSFFSQFSSVLINLNFD